MPICPDGAQAVFIYDSKCSPCWKYARLASRLSRGRIVVMGHHDMTVEAERLKRSVFPIGYDPTSMSWLINKTGAYGGRAGLVPLVAEILRGLISGPGADRAVVTETEFEPACASHEGLARRLLRFMQSSGRFEF